MAEISHQPQASEAKGQVTHWRNRLYYEPSDIEIEKVILRAFEYEDPRHILPQASVCYGHLLIRGLRTETYERVTKVLSALYPENLLNLKYVHNGRSMGRNYLAVSNRHSLGRCLAKCLADSFAGQINQIFAQLGHNMTEDSAPSVAWADGTKSWYTPSDPTGGLDDCVYCPDNQVRVMTRNFMPPILIYVVSERDIRHTRDKVMTLVHHNLGVAGVVIISVDQVHQYNLDGNETSNNNSGPQPYLPSLPRSTNSTIRHGDKVFVTVLKVVSEGDRRCFTWPIENAEIFPRPTERKLKATFKDLTLVPWYSSAREPEFCLNFDDLTECLVEDYVSRAEGMIEEE